MRKSTQKFICQYSNEFLKGKKFYIEQTGYLMKFNPKTEVRTEETAFQNALKQHLKRHGVDPFRALNIIPFVCAFCGHNNSTWDLTYTANGKKINLTGVKYRKPGYFCHGKHSDCRGKKLNPNSIEFVKHNLGISEEEAIAKIHERNKSPFYAKNHSSLENYASFQRSQFYGRDLDKVRSGLEKIQQTRCLNEQGLKARRSGFSFITEEDGHLLRSNGERFFYRYAKRIGIDKFLESNGFYPESILCFDFYIPQLGIYIEISGLNHKKYLERIEEKVNTFNAVVLKFDRHFKKTCQNFLDNVKIQLMESKHV